MSIDTSEKVSLEEMNGTSRKLGGPVRLTLSRGVYRVISEAQVTVSVATIVKPGVEIVIDDIRDEVPQPRPQILPNPNPESEESQAFIEACRAFLAKEPENDEVAKAKADAATPST